MEIIAFLRFKNTLPKSKKHNKPDFVATNYAQPPDLIIEYAPTSSFPEGFHKESNGYEFLPQDLFEIELAKTNEIRVKHKADVARILDIEKAGEKAEAIVQKAADRETYREFEEFKRWKESKRLQKDEIRGKK